MPPSPAKRPGIIKPGVPAVVMRQSEEILGIFREKGEITVAEPPEPIEITPYGSRFRLPFGEFSIRLPGRASDAQRIAGSLRPARSAWF